MHAISLHLLKAMLDLQGDADYAEYEKAAGGIDEIQVRGACTCAVVSYSKAGVNNLRLMRLFCAVWLHCRRGPDCQVCTSKGSDSFPSSSPYRGTPC